MGTEAAFIDKRWDFYAKESERMYLRSNRLEEQGKLREDRKAYRPAPFDIEQRIQDLRWLQSQGFKNRFIACVMQQEHPTIEKVVHLIDVKGWTAEEVYLHFKNELPRTEYDREECVGDEKNQYLNRYENLRPTPKEMRDFTDQGEHDEGTPRTTGRGTKVRVLRRRVKGRRATAGRNEKGSK
jgi:hypothetical protein